MMRLLTVGLCLLAAGTAHSLAQDEYRAGDDRYLVSEVDGGVLRVDRLSGAVSMCRQRDGWECALVPDDRDAMQREIEDLRMENRRLRRQLARFDPGFAERGYAYERPQHEDDDDGVVTRKEIDETMDSFEYMMERLLGAAGRFGYDEPPAK
jgi:hypothetical protein